MIPELWRSARMSRSRAAMGVDPAPRSRMALPRSPGIGVKGVREPTLQSKIGKNPLRRTLGLPGPRLAGR